MSWNQGSYTPPTQNVPAGTVVVGVDSQGRQICRINPRDEQAYIVHYTPERGYVMEPQGQPSPAAARNPGNAGGGMSRQGAAAGGREGWYETQDRNGRRCWQHIPTGQVSYYHPGP